MSRFTCFSNLHLVRNKFKKLLLVHQIDADANATTLIFGSHNSTSRKVFVCERSSTKTFALDQEIMATG